MPEIVVTQDTPEGFLKLEAVLDQQRRKAMGSDRKFSLRLLKTALRSTLTLDIENTAEETKLFAQESAAMPAEERAG